MSQLSWNEIRNNAIKFSRDWAGTTEERAESQSFWNDFFQVFGLSRKLLATFEQPVVSFEGTKHRIDVYWKGTLLAEHKSAGVSLGKALDQALTYVQELEAGGARGSLPRYIVLSDFNRFLLHDLAPDDGAPGERRLIADFPLADFHENVRHFAFMIGQKTHRFGDEDPANIEAAEIMADLHDAVKEGGYDQAFLERFLVRILFCLFADDTGIFEPGQFELYIANHTKEDGSDLGGKLRDLFEILDTPPERRSKYLDEDLAAFPYVNGELFSGQTPLAGFNRDMRNRLTAALHFDWSRISPAIFGSLFQGIMDGKERRQIGAHYTSERDILKLIRPLFLDALQEEFDKIAKLQRGREERLRAFQKKLRSLKFLDPACGCGNFLVIAYRELRKLETAALKLLYNFDKRGQDLDLGEVAKLSHVDVDQFYGIEIGEWPTRIAETALWLTDHQMNTQLSLAAGNTYQRIPLRAAPHIRCANALRMDWNELLPAKECAYVLGNPPFIGHHNQTPDQKSDQNFVLKNIQARGVLDFVCNWYVKACEYIEGTQIPVAFVSTNSISQGEQTSILWSELLNRYRTRILFAHRTFAWKSEAKGAAHVHVVIIGFGCFEPETRRLFEYLHIDGDPEERIVKSINPYLIEGSDTLVMNRNSPICNVPAMRYGNKPTDGGFLILDAEEYKGFVRTYPESKPFLRPLVCAHEFLHGKDRWCLWLVDASPKDIRNIPGIMERVESVRLFRLASKAESTREYAKRPTQFRQLAQPDSDYIVVPRHTSEKRAYIPFGFLGPEYIVHDSCSSIPNATTFHFGVMSSQMHMAWVKTTCGRLESRYRYTKDIVYNNFPWPIHATDAQRAKVSELAEGVLRVRQGYLEQGNTLADLYDPISMPVELLKAHQALDKAVDQCYRKAPFASDRERVEFLFGLYEELTAPLAAAEKEKKEKPRRARRDTKGE